MIYISVFLSIVSEFSLLILFNCSNSLSSILSLSISFINISKFSSFLPWTYIIRYSEYLLFNTGAYCKKRKCNKRLKLIKMSFTNHDMKNQLSSNLVTKIYICEQRNTQSLKNTIFYSGSKF